MITTSQLLIALLVPLAVSFVLFKFLNSKASVKGKAISGGVLKDIQFDLGGAFAAYIILAAGILYYYSYQAMHHREQVWLVKGALKFSTQTNSLRPENIAIIVEPPYKALDDGTFDFSLIVDKKMGFPKLKFHHHGFSPEVVHIQPHPGAKKYDVSVDEEEKLVLINEPIILSANQ